MQSNNSTNTWVVGTKVIKLPTCHSTNEQAALLAREGAPEGSVVYTEVQTAGRGQRGNAWFSLPESSLCFSVLLRPTFLLAREQIKLSVAVAIALQKALQHFLPNERVELKWPNDALVNGKKIAGVLIENALVGQHLGSCVVGIGLNIGPMDFDATLEGKACTMAAHFPADTSWENLRTEVFEHLLKELDASYLRLRGGQYQHLLQEYYMRLYGFQQELWYEDAEGHRFRGTIKGIDERGCLKLLVDNELYIYDLKEIRLLGEALQEE